MRWTQTWLKVNPWIVWVWSSLDVFYMMYMILTFSTFETVLLCRNRSDAKLRHMMKRFESVWRIWAINKLIKPTFPFFLLNDIKLPLPLQPPQFFFLCFFPEFLISGRWRWLNTVSAVKSSDLLVCHIKGLLTFPAVSSNHRSSLCPRGHITDSSHDTESKPSSLKEMSNFLEVSYNVEICLSLFMELG